MAEIVVIPKMNLIMERGIIGHWFKTVGDYVTEGDPLFDVENEKEVSEVTAMATGAILKIWGVEGETYPVAAPVALIGGPDENVTEIIKQIDELLASMLAQESDNFSSDNPSSDNRSSDNRSSEALDDTSHNETTVKMLPKLRKIIRDKGIDINALVKFCGKNRITEQDIYDYESSQIRFKDTSALSNIGDFGSRRNTMSGMRRKIASHMMDSVLKTAMLTNVTEVDMTKCVKTRKSIESQERAVSLTAMVIKACAIAIKEYEIINAALNENEIIYHDSINISCAVDVPGGLMTPVIHNADKLDIYTITDNLSAFSNRGKSGELTNDDMSGGTFTVSNVGMLGVKIFTPILNYPQAAIMGIGAINRVPRYIDDNSETLVPKHMMNLCLTYDHRLIDGALAARFAARVRDALEDCAILFGQ